MSSRHQARPARLSAGRFVRFFDLGRRWHDHDGDVRPMVTTGLRPNAAVLLDQIVVEGAIVQDVGPFPRCPVSIAPAVWGNEDEPAAGVGTAADALLEHA